MGFAIFALLPLVRNLVWTPVADFAWVPSEAYSLKAFAETLRYLIQAVIFEELLFRGYLLWLAIRYLGRKWGVILSAVPNHPPTDTDFAIKVMIDMIWPLAFTGLAIWALGRYYRKADNGTIKNQVLVEK